MATQNMTEKTNCEPISKEGNGEAPYESRKERLPRDLAWEVVRELVFTVSRFGSETESKEKYSASDFESLGRMNHMLQDVLLAVGEFNKWDEANDARTIASDAHLELQKIYKRVISGELSVSDSRAEIITMIEPHLELLTTRKVDGTPVSFIDHDRIAKCLVKAPDEISIGIKDPTSADGNKRAITGPATIADQALGELLGVGYRAVNDRRKGDGHKHLTYRYRYCNSNLVEPGVTDLPYNQIVETLSNVFHLDLEKIIQFTVDLGANLDACFPFAKDDHAVETSETPKTSIQDEAGVSRSISLPRIVLRRIAD